MELLETPKDSCYIVCRGNDSKFRTKFSPTLNSRGCEIAVVGLSTYYSYPNINENNNTFAIAGPNVSKIFQLQKGCYEVSDINDVIKKTFHWITDDKQDTAMVKLNANQVTLRTHITIKKDDKFPTVPWILTFPEEGGINLLLGFENKIMTFTGPGEWTSPKIANILSVNNSVTSYRDRVLTENQHL